MRKTFFALAALGIIAVVALASTASAHSRPIRFSIPPGSVLTSTPDQLTAWFVADLRNDPNWNFLKVEDAQGNQVDDGNLSLATNRLSMSVGLRPGLPEGRYLVTWRSWDDIDGAIFGDCYTFFVGQAAADEAVSEGIRLDGGEACERIEVDARGGTPVPGSTPAAGGEHGHDESDSDGSGIPLWALIVGVGVGVMVGGIGGKLAGARG